MDLTRYRALSFDCYGTLIDWEAGIAAVLGPWATSVGLDLDDERLLEAYAGNEAAVERERPAARYPEVLAEAFRRTGEAMGRTVDDAWARRLGDSVPDWPAFGDSAGALASLASHYQLLVVSNVHHDGFAASNRRLRGRFAAVITAEDVGAYKPAADHFQALLRTVEGLGITPGELLHVAQSLFHDHVPAKRAGLATVWINRRHDRPAGAPPPSRPKAGATTSSCGRWASSPPRPTPPSPPGATTRRRGSQADLNEGSARVAGTRPGFGNRFGLINVDFQTQQRIPKLSAGWFRAAARRNAVV